LRAIANADSNTNAYSYSDCDADRYTHGYGDGNAYANCDAMHGQMYTYSPASSDPTAAPVTSHAILLPLRTIHIAGVNDSG
jgi:hypothetical protein